MAEFVYKNISVERNANFNTEITIKNPVLYSIFDKNTKITNATLILKIEEKIGSNYGFPVKINDYIVDYLKGETGNIAINIIDEFQNMIRKNKDNIVITVEGTDSNYLEFSIVEKKLQVEYIPERVKLDNNSYYKTDVKRAGSGSINLASGILDFVHNDVVSDGNVLPVSISHIYNSAAAGKREAYFNYNTPESEEIKLTDNRCGKGWKLNLQQYIVKNQKPNEYIETETADAYTYIDGSGNYHLFEERYYFDNPDTGNKEYLKKEEIIIDSDQNLWHEFYGRKLEVKKDYKTTAGLELKPELTVFKGLEYIDQKPEEVIQLQAQVDELKYNITSLETALDNNSTNLALINKNIEIRNLQINAENHALNSELSAINYQYGNIGLQSSISYTSKTLRTKIDERTYVHLDAENYPTSAESTAKNTLNGLQDNYETVTNSFELGENFNGQTNGALKEKKDSYDLRRIIADKNTNYYNLDSAFQIEQLQQQEQNLNDQLEKYQTELIKKEHELDKYLSAMPVHIISDSRGNIMGFGKTENENVFRLLLIADSYENHILIEYEDSKEKQEYDKILSVVDGSDNTVKFEYFENKLSKITDSRGRIISYKYGLDNLTQIIYPDKSVTYFNYDENDRMISAIEPSGYGFSYTYNESSQIIKITEITHAEKISHNSVINYEESFCGEGICGDNVNYTFKFGEVTDIDYYDYKSTTVSGNKGKTLTYVFDILGRPATVYENVLNNEEEQVTDYIKVASYDYTGDKKAFSITPLINSEDYLNQGFDGIDYESNLVGEGIYVNEEHSISLFEGHIHILDAVLNDKNILCMTVAPETIAEINASGATDFILSGWAKADSAFINRDRSTQYSYSDIDTLHIDTFDEYKTKRRFELRAELTYNNNSATRAEQYCSFDWMNTGWQYCAFPVTLNENEGDVLTGLKLYFDYSYNTNGAKFCNLSLKEGSWNYSEFDKDGLQTYSEDSLKRLKTTYEYDGGKNLIKTKTTNKDNDIFINEYRYNQNNCLVRSIDYRGIVSENIYDDKGKAVKKVTYNKNEPSTKIYDEKEYDEKGNVTGSIDELGNKNGEYEYIKGTGIISKTTEPDGQITSYGYDYNDDTLLSISASADGEDNGSVRGYTKGYLTRLSHNNTDFDYSYDGFGKQKEVYAAGEKYLENEYSDNETITTNANGESYKTVYDSEDRVTEVKFKGKTDTEYSNYIKNNYDYKGQLLSSTDYTNGTDTEYTNTYDKYGRVTETAYSRSGNEISATSQYDNNGNVSNSAYSVNNGTQNISKAYSYSYDNKPDSRLESVILPNGFTQHIKYDGLGRAAEHSLDNAFSNNIYYLKNGDHTSGLVSSMWYGVNGSVKDNIKYTYNDKLNIRSVKENGIETVRYSYDGLNRLVREDNKRFGLNGKTTVFAYNAGGNIVSKTEYPYTTSEMLNEEQIIETINYGYKFSGWRDQMTSYNGFDCEYDDKLGNPTTYKNDTLIWSHGRQLDAYNNITYTYNAGGIRTGKTAGGVTTSYYYNGGNLMYQDNGTDKLWFHYGADGITGFNYNGTEYIYRRNAQGDITHIIDTTGNIVVKYVYDAWGSHIVCNPDGTENTDNAFIGNINPIRYRGYYYDSDTGLYYLKSRYYDPETGRFINADDVSYLDAESINGLNLYSYCGNNPVMRTDLNGNAWWDWVISGALIVAGAALCFVPGAQGLGVALVVAGGSMLATNIMSAAGVDGKTASIISSALNIVAGIALCFTPFAAVGASMIGSGIGGLAGGYISEALGGSFELGSMIGSIIGGIAGGKIYDGIRTAQLAKSGAVVLGEGMSRVTTKAGEIGATTYGGMPGFKTIEKLVSKSKFLTKALNKLGLAHNARWIKWVAQSGANIVDIGIAGRNSANYLMEILCIGKWLL